MRERARVFIAACFYYSGLVKVAHWWIRRSRQRLIILNYHRATGGDLHRQMLYLHRHYRILHLEEALEELYTPHKEKQVDDPRMPLVLPRDRWADWLDPAREDVEALAAPTPPEVVEALELRPVGTAVNNVRNNGPELLARAESVSAPADQPALF